MTHLEEDQKVDRPTYAVEAAIRTACDRVAPTWPLDQFIAVNPYWGFRSEPIRNVATRLETYSGSRMLMPRSFYLEQWRNGSLRSEHLQAALRNAGVDMPIEELLLHLETEAPAAPRFPLFTSIADAQRDLLHAMSITDFVTHNVSQHCASYFDRSQSSWETQHHGSLYESWLQHARTDRSPWLLMGIHKMRHHADALSSNPMELIHTALQALPVPPEDWEDYLTALLMSINGWASWCAYERWQANLAQQEDDHIVQLLAIRLAWEHFTFLHLLYAVTPPEWTSALDTLHHWRSQSSTHRLVDWIFQEALEISYQTQLCESLSPTLSGSFRNSVSTPDVQAVFCIDVRSEVFRRSLESCSDGIQTFGFAGFFGLPIAYMPLGAATAQPQLPGLLAPSFCVTDTTGSSEADQQAITRKRSLLALKSIWKDFRSSATSTFTFVESWGLFYAVSLLKRSLPMLSRTSNSHVEAASKAPALRPHISQGNDQQLPAIQSLADVAAGILRNMGLTAGFARLVLLTGHGSQTSNNPHAAGLDCGACGGQAGDVNARVLAGLLNDPALRTALRTRGIDIPETTHVLPALHNTTTDEVTIFDTDLLPGTHRADLARLQTCLKQAGHLARLERATHLDIERRTHTSADALLHQFQTRSIDWSQVRPEWGLANNAALLIAPRTRSRGINLEGRVFLHEYEPTQDGSGVILEAIMTAPMVVANWINMQYYASTVDNKLYGSGNKVLHNVVGGRLGVFEGNGGDLRIGLPLQSLHDGHTLRHTPLRLSVFIEAPQSNIDAIITRHQVVSDLIENQWIHLFQISPETHTISKYREGTWEPFPYPAVSNATKQSAAGNGAFA